MYRTLLFQRKDSVSRFFSSLLFLTYFCLTFFHTFLLTLFFSCSSTGGPIISLYDPCIGDYVYPGMLALLVQLLNNRVAFYVMCPYPLFALSVQFSFVLFLSYCLFRLDAIRWENRRRSLFQNAVHTGLVLLFLYAFLYLYFVKGYILGGFPNRGDGMRYFSSHGIVNLVYFSCYVLILRTLSDVNISKLKRVIRWIFAKKKY